MLHHQHGFVVRHALHQSGNAFDILMRHARGRLVEQNHFGVEGQRGGDFQSTLAAIGQFGGLLVLQIQQAHIGQQGPRLLVILRQQTFGAPEIERSAALAL